MGNKIVLCGSTVVDDLLSKYQLTEEDLSVFFNASKETIVKLIDVKIKDNRFCFRRVPKAIRSILESMLYKGDTYRELNTYNKRVLLLLPKTKDTKIAVLAICGNIIYLNRYLEKGLEDIAIENGYYKYSSTDLKIKYYLDKKFSYKTYKAPADLGLLIKNQAAICPHIDSKTVSDYIRYLGFNRSEWKTKLFDYDLSYDIKVLTYMVDKCKISLSTISKALDVTNKSLTSILKGKSTGSSWETSEPLTLIEETKVEELIKEGRQLLISLDFNLLLIESPDANNVAVLVCNRVDGKITKIRLIHLTGELFNLYKEKYQGFTIDNYKVKNEIIQLVSRQTGIIKPLALKRCVQKFTTRLNKYSLSVGLSGTEIERIKKYLDYLLWDEPDVRSRFEDDEKCLKELTRSIVKQQCNIRGNIVPYNLSYRNGYRRLRRLATKYNMSVDHLLYLAGYKRSNLTEISETKKGVLGRLIAVVLKYYEHDGVVTLPASNRLYVEIKEKLEHLNCSVEQYFEEFGYQLIADEDETVPTFESLGLTKRDTYKIYLDYLIESNTDHNTGVLRIDSKSYEYCAISKLLNRLDLPKIATYVSSLGYTYQTIILEDLPNKDTQYYEQLIKSNLAKYKREDNKYYLNTYMYNYLTTKLMPKAGLKTQEEVEAVIGGDIIRGKHYTYTPYVILYILNTYCESDGKWYMPRSFYNRANLPICNFYKNKQTLSDLGVEVIKEDASTTNKVSRIPEDFRTFTDPKLLWGTFVYYFNNNKDKYLKDGFFRLDKNSFLAVILNSFLLKTSYTYLYVEEQIGCSIQLVAEPLKYLPELPPQKLQS